MANNKKEMALRASLEVLTLSPSLPPIAKPSRTNTPRPKLGADSSELTVLIVPKDTIPLSTNILNFARHSLPPPPAHLFPSSLAQITDRTFLSSFPHLPLQARHVLLPFNLRLNPAAWHNGQNSDILSSLIPPSCDGFGESFDGWVLTYYVKHLPVKPWPTTVAGVPVYFSLRFGDRGALPCGALACGRGAGWRNPSIEVAGGLAEGFDGRNCTPGEWDTIFEMVTGYFGSEEVGTEVVEVQYWRMSVYIVLGHRISEDDCGKLLCRIGKVPCRYLFEGQIRPRPPP
jgi:hypothetical protein